MKMEKLTIDYKLLQAEIAIQSALNNDEIKKALAVFGVQESEILANKALLDETRLRHANQIKEYAEQFEMTSTLEKLFDDSFSEYMRHVRLARIVFKNDLNLMKNLDVRGKRKRSYSGFVDQANTFYLNLLDKKEAVSEMANRSFSKKNLEDNFAKINEIASILAKRKREMSDAHDATRLRDEALDQLEDWLVDFREYARLALEGQPKLLEALGLIQAQDVD